MVFQLVSVQWHGRSEANGYFSLGQLILNNLLSLDTVQLPVCLTGKPAFSHVQKIFIDSNIITALILPANEGAIARISLLLFFFMYFKKPHILIFLALSSSIIHSFYPYPVFYILFFRLLCFMYMYSYYIYFKFHGYCPNCFFVLITSFI